MLSGFESYPRWVPLTYHAVGGTWAKMYTIINQRNYLFIVRRVLRFASEKWEMAPTPVLVFKHLQFC